mmetsp:Transcript_10877/g.40562  ORF Transcript_10877/g.40562 Transcript_10877/m.40562 type:complete len:336 (-) Transcript_10877:193-1200(-)
MNMNYKLGVSSDEVDDPDKWKISDFTLLETLGTGTFGRVKLCKHRKSGRYFAMKILRKADIIRLKQVEHLMSEKAVLSSLDHPFIVKLYKTFQDEHTLYMIMEYVVGGELFFHLRKVGKFPNDVAKFYAAEIILAMEYLHKQNIVYRDLKPENILLGEKGHVKITDFGFAKKVVDRTWTLCGTPEYLAPEIIQSKGHGKAVDWWALGILIYEMLVGYPPFFDDSPFKIYEKILTGRIEFPRFMDSAAKDIIRKLLTTDKMKRIGNLKNGPDDIKNHPWFRGVNWEHLYGQLIPSPIQVKVTFAGDSRYYENYPEVQSEKGMEPLGKDVQNMFADF